MSQQQCGARYERRGGRQDGDRVVRCDRPAGHVGMHLETATGNTWLDTPARTVQADESQQMVARTKVVQSIEGLPPVPEVHLSYDAGGLEIDIWVRGDLPFDALADRAYRGLEEAVKPEIAQG